jgi:hypothetical protein
LRTNSPLVTLLAVSPLVVLILGLTACVEHPIGDPEKSKVDEKFVGVWKTDHDLLFFRPYDARTYLITNLTVAEKTDDGVSAERRSDYKGWLTPIGDATFITLEPLSLAHFAGVGGKLPFFIARIALVDDQLQLRVVDGGEQMVRDAKNRDELEAVIREHVSSESLYSSQAEMFERVADKEYVKSVLQAFPDEF